MTRKVELNELTSVVNEEKAFLFALNENFKRLQESIEDSLSRSARTPNEMLDVIDMNGNRIINVGEAINPDDALTKRSIIGIIEQVESAIARLDTLIEEAKVSIKVYVDEKIYPVIVSALQNAIRLKEEAQVLLDTALAAKDQIEGWVVEVRADTKIAKDSADTAVASANRAATSEQNASRSEVNAGVSERNALTYSNNAEAAKTQAETSAANALRDSIIARDQAGIATTKAGEASVSAKNAQTSKEDAETAATNAQGSEDRARLWAEGDDIPVQAIGGTHSSLVSAGLSYAYANAGEDVPVEDFAALHNVIVQGEKGDQGPKGDTGEKGEKGDKGDKGEKGEEGSQGIPGFSPSAQVSKEGSTITITITDKEGTTEASATIEEVTFSNLKGAVSDNTALSEALEDKQDKITSSSLLSSSLISTDSSHRFVSDSDKTNWNNKLSSITSSMVTTALGFTPYNSTNPSGYITSSALNGYATQTWVGQQGYLTSSSLSGYATQTWVGQQGYLTLSTLPRYDGSST